jgi:hypothetical protein
MPKTGNHQISQIDIVELIGVNPNTGFDHPDAGIRYGLGSVLGFLGSASRSSTLLQALMAYFQVTEETGNVPTTIAAAATSTTANTSILPANSLILLVGWRVTVAIPTATTFSLGSTGQPTRFGTGLSTALGSGICIDHWNPANAAGAGVGQATAGGILITPNATPGAATGRVALQVLALTGVPPTA